MRFRFHGLNHRYEFIGGKWWLQISLENQWRTCANVELPVDESASHAYKAHPLDGLCRVCGLVFSHLLLNAGQPCCECKLELVAEREQMLGLVKLDWVRSGKTGQWRQEVNDEPAVWQVRRLSNHDAELMGMRRTARPGMARHDDSTHRCPSIERMK